MGRSSIIPGCLVLCLSARASQALTTREEVSDHISLIQLSKQDGSEAEAEESAVVYRAVAAALSNHSNLSHSRHIWKFVASQPYAPRLRGSGCIYLPSDDAWRSFYEWVEHPYPPLFAELIANAWDPQCGQGEFAACPAGHVEGSHWTLLEGEQLASPRPQADPHQRAAQNLGPGIDGCLGAKYRSTTNNIQIFETEGHVGLPGKWKRHVTAIRKKQGKPEHKRRRQGSRVPPDVCHDSAELPAVPPDQKLAVPTRFIICCADRLNCPVKPSIIKGQVDWMTKGYSGQEALTQQLFDFDMAPPSVDMQVEFDLLEIRYVQDEECAQKSFTNTSLAYRHNTDGDGILTYVIMTDDQSGVLGMAEFPFDWQESSPQLIVMVDSRGLRGYAAMTGADSDLAYNEGDTSIHEGGHSLGLLHTFEGGCSVDGDRVLDTAPEKFPMYTCDEQSSCNTINHDPVHNFMDYTPDSCMSGFTEMQKRRLWCMVRNYRPNLYQRALRSL